MIADINTAGPGIGDRELPVCRASELDQASEQQPWLIDGLWGRSAVGILGGSPKCGKSFLGLEMSVSVASATPCLGRFQVEDPGPALVYLAEDALPELRERLEGLCQYHRVALNTLPLYVITAPVLRLDQPGDQKRLVATLARLRPRLLLLDPLVRLHRLNENHASEVSWLLGYIRELQRTFDLSVVLVHHVSKRPCAELGQTLRGSSDLHAFGDSNAYLQRRERTLLLSLEHRFAAAREPIALELVADTKGRAHLEMTNADKGVSRISNVLAQGVLNQLHKADAPMSRAVLREKLKVNNKRLGETLQQLEDQGRIRHLANGWTLVSSSPGPIIKNKDATQTDSLCQPPLFTLSGKTEAGSGGVHPAKG